MLFLNVEVHFFRGKDIYKIITIDTVTDTVYASPDVTTHIRHFNKDGTPGANDSIDFETLTAGLCPWAQGFGANGCWNSGLAIGIDGSLFAGTASDGKIFQLNPVAPATLIGQFATVSGRDEDLECGPLTADGRETILSKQFEGPIDVLEAPEGTCVSPVVEPEIDGRMTGGGSVFTDNGVRVTHGFELHCDEADEPNRLQVNWGKGNKFHLESLTSAACADDPNLDEEQPVAGFDTYKGTGTGRLNGVSGATADWEFTDDGEPGTSDHVRLQIKDVNNVVVLTVSGALDRGNHQAHPAE